MGPSAGSVFNVGDFHKEDVINGSWIQPASAILECNALFCLVVGLALMYSARRGEEIT